MGRARACFRVPPHLLSPCCDREASRPCSVGRGVEGRSRVSRVCLVAVLPAGQGGVLLLFCRVFLCFAWSEEGVGWSGVRAAGAGVNRCRGFATLWRPQWRRGLGRGFEGAYPRFLVFDKGSL